MGGLRTKLPWTFWTMTAATLAISGIPGFAGFFSKDEILWRTYQASWAYWLIGVITAFITSFYMFRLWFLTFFGEYRGAVSTSHAVETHSAGDTAGSHGHGHGGIHESPKIMLVPLVILAILSVVGGYVGVPGSLGGSNRFDHFLGPVFRSTVTAGSGQTQAGEKGASETETEGTEPKTEATRELSFTGISVFAALLGFALAWQLYYRRPDWPQKIATSIAGLYRVVAGGSHSCTRGWASPLPRTRRGPFLPPNCAIRPPRLDRTATCAPPTGAP